MMIEIKVGLALIGSILKFIQRLIPATINYIARPKVKIQIKNCHIAIRDSNDVEAHISYPCLVVSFLKDIKIDVSSIKLNNETLHCMLSRDPNFLNQKKGSKHQVTITNNRIMPFVSENWSDLNQRACWFEMKSHEQEVFPLYLHGNMSHFLFHHKKETKILMARKKLVISMCVDGKTYEYTLPLLDVCKLIINNLVFKLK